MPIDDDGDDSGLLRAPPQIGPSAVGEVAWVLIHLTSDKRPPADSPVLGLVAAADDLRTEVRALCAASADCAADLYVLADRIGALVGADLAPFLARLPEAAAAVAADGRVGLTIEPPALIEATRATILRYAADPALLERYRAMLAAIWERYLPIWNSKGRAKVAERVAELTARVAGGAGVLDLVPDRHVARKQRHLEALGPLLESLPVVVSPVYSAWSGGHLFDTIGAVILGLPVVTGPGRERLRIDSERVASALKVLSDPTRVALLSAIASDPSSVTDLAETFDLAQPTVSVHLAKLRAAGLLTQHKHNGRTVYSTTSDHVERLLDDARDVLLQACTPH